MKVCVIGSKGQIGSILADLVDKAGHDVSRIDLEEIGRAEETILGSDATILAVPLAPIIDYIERFGTRRTIIEVSSVKAPLIKHSGKFISIHPLFGPHSFPDNRSVCLINDISLNGSEVLLRSLLPQCDFISMTAEEHDRLMVGSLVAPYLLSIMARSLAGDGNPMTRSGSVMKDLTSILGDMNPDVISDTIRLNPNTRNLVDSFEEILRSVKEAAIQ